MIELLVLADDRTGALETAGECANAGIHSVVVSHVVDTVARGCVVIDLGSRHLAPDQAAARVHTESVVSRRQAHKIDSMLRGNWAHELVALDQRVLLVPAFPAIGRRCRGGVVFDGDRPIADGTTARHPVRSSRPRDHLVAAGATDVTELSSLDPNWFGEGSLIAVCDAAGDAELEDVAAQWITHPEIVLAGTSAVIGAAARALRGESGAVLPPVCRPVVVVCGSRHATALAQVAALQDLAGVIVLTPPTVQAVPEAVAMGLADAARERWHEAATVIIVGGDTAAAVLGDAPVRVYGNLVPGVAFSSRLDAPSPLIVTKPGSFGDHETLARLISGGWP